MPDDTFKEFVLDQLSALPDVRAKAMFGAHGIYSGDHFFGILDEGRLFFKTDAASAASEMGRVDRLARCQVGAAEEQRWA